MARPYPGRLLPYAILFSGIVSILLWWHIEQIEMPPQPKAPPLPGPHAAAPAAPSGPAGTAASAPAEPRAATTTQANDDGLILRELERLIRGSRLDGFIVTDGLARRIVATVDALPRAKVSQAVWPFQPVPGAFQVGEAPGRAWIAAGNAQRYLPYVHAFLALDTDTLVAAYRRAYPQLQRAYESLGYPRASFNDRLVAAIDDALSAPAPLEPIAVDRPNVLYTYADPDLESCSAGRKLLMRLGDASGRAVRRKLREVRARLLR